MNKLFMLPPLFAAQHELLHFASRVLGQAAELYRSWALEMRQILTAEGNDLGFGRTLIWFQGDKCLGALPPLLIGDSDDATFQHRRMLGNNLLHLDRRDILATGNDDVLFAITQLN